MQSRRLFLATMCLVAAVVIVVGWAIGARIAMHSLVLALAPAGPWVLALPIALVVLVLLTDASRVAPRVIGAFAGLALGPVLGGLLVVRVVLPGEEATAQSMLRARSELEQHFVRSRAFPKTASYRDGFGHLMTYSTSGAWTPTSWSLRSDGFDGKPSADDLCLFGTTKLEGNTARDLRTLACPR